MKQMQLENERKLQQIRERKLATQEMNGKGQAPRNNETSGEPNNSRKDESRSRAKPPSEHRNSVVARPRNPERKPTSKANLAGAEGSEDYDSEEEIYTAKRPQHRGRK